MTWILLDGSGPPDFHGAVSVASPKYASKLIMPNEDVDIDRGWGGWYWKTRKVFTIFPKRELRMFCLDRTFAPIMAWKPRVDGIELLRKAAQGAPITSPEGPDTVRKRTEVNTDHLIWPLEEWEME